ncbi:MAG TPA: competence/damage-inducible protein A [Vicinamibacterales bacterium]|nr:competence/damage-inducible protein A [Vicinamibacterales bacterium]
MSASPFRRAAILAIGSELLTPSRIDTNSLFITNALNAIGIDVLFKAVAGDDRVELKALFAHALDRVDLVVLTGGLGPTEDDVTREVVADHLGLALAEDQAITDAIRRRFEARGWVMPEINRRQAMVPSGALVIANANGTAPGLWIEHGNQGMLLVPGPPREMRPMVEQVVAERLRARADGRRLMRRILKIAGRSESRVEELTQPLYSRWRALQPPIETTILAAPGQIELHLSARGIDPAALDSALDRAAGEIEAVLPNDVFSSDGRTIEEVVGALLAARGWHIALAESCTGGLATSRLTDVPGSSAYVERGVVAYSNEAKIEMLGVGADLLTAFGAVSEPVAQSMAEGIRDRAKVEVAVGITGIAGPTGGSESKPVGTVCISVVTPQQTTVRTLRFPGNRELVKTFAAFTALDMVRRLLLHAPANADWTERRS